ncbi:MAG TPA: hypothetical protein VF533_16635 [Solirubrobacteraceae bacterium]|jgi:hypothetical protein
MSRSPLPPTILAAAAAALALSPGAASAAAAAPTVRATADGTAVTVEAPAGLRAGALTLRLSVHSPSKPRTLTVLRLRDGASAAEAAGTDTQGLGDVRALERRAVLVSGATVRPGTGFRSTIPAAAGRYAIVDESADPPAYATFDVGAGEAGAKAPAATGRLRMGDRSFGAPRRIARRGVLRIDNAGTRPHHVLAIRIAQRMSDARAIELARDGGDLSRIGYASDLLGLVSAGTSNRVHYRLKGGRWVLVSYYGALLPDAKPDALRGLVDVVRVK